MIGYIKNCAIPNSHYTCIWKYNGWNFTSNIVKNILTNENCFISLEFHWISFMTVKLISYIVWTWRNSWSGVFALMRNIHTLCIKTITHRTERLMIKIPYMIRILIIYFPNNLEFLPIFLNRRGTTWVPSSLGCRSPGQVWQTAIFDVATSKERTAVRKLTTISGGTVSPGKSILNPNCNILIKKSPSLKSWVINSRWRFSYLWNKHAIILRDRLWNVLTFKDRKINWNSEGFF